MKPESQQQRRRDTYEVRRPPEDHCHCVGHRLLIVIGSPANATIQATLSWALSLNNVNHKVHFRTPRAGGTPMMDAPYVPNAAGNGWERFQRPGTTNNGNTGQLSRTFDDCCFFEEVMVMAHGSTPGIEAALIRDLPVLFGGRPVRKFVLWLCSTSKDVYPRHSNNRHYYERLCGIVKPKRCPCMCDLALCDGRCHDPEGNRRAGYRCPDVTDCTTLFAAAWYEHRLGSGSDINVPSKLGINLAPTNNGQPLTSPDGRMRQVTICANATAASTPANPQYEYSAEVRLVTNPTVFDGFSVQADAGLKEYRPTSSDNINTNWRLRRATARPEANPAPYNGPTACAGLDGCFLDAV